MATGSNKPRIALVYQENADFVRRKMPKPKGVSGNIDFIGYIAVGIVLFLLGLGLLAGLYEEREAYFQRQKSSDTVVGKVSNLTTGTSGGRRFRTRNYSLHYEYAVNGETYTQTEGIGEEDYKEIPLGMPIRVRYATVNPANAVLADLEDIDPLMEWFSLVIVGLFIGSIGAFIYAQLNYSKNTKLVKEGQIIQGWVVNVKVKKELVKMESELIYGFISPKTGLEVTKTKEFTDNETAKRVSRMPPNMAVLILYRNDNHNQPL